MNEYIKFWDVWILPKYQSDWEIQIQHMCSSDLINLDNYWLKTVEGVYNRLLKAFLQQELHKSSLKTRNLILRSSK